MFSSRVAPIFMGSRLLELSWIQQATPIDENDAPMTLPAGSHDLAFAGT